jgi:hypothetical protein
MKESCCMANLIIGQAAGAFTFHALCHVTGHQAEG